MQTAEKVTSTFVLKLLLLFVLLIAGVMFKTADLTQTVDAKDLNVSPSSTAMEQDSQQIKQLYMRMVNSKSSASI